MKPWKEVIDGIRNAVLGKEVREDIAQMGEYVEQFANTAGENIQKAIDPTLSISGKAADAAKVGEAVGQLKEDVGYYEITFSIKAGDKHTSKVDRIRVAINADEKFYVRCKANTGELLAFQVWGYYESKETGTLLSNTAGEREIQITSDRQYDYIGVYVDTVENDATITFSINKENAFSGRALDLIDEVGRKDLAYVYISRNKGIAYNWNDSNKIMEITFQDNMVVIFQNREIEINGSEAKNQLGDSCTVEGEAFTIKVKNANDLVFDTDTEKLKICSRTKVKDQYLPLLHVHYGNISGGLLNNIALRTRIDELNIPDTELDIPDDRTKSKINQFCNLFMDTDDVTSFLFFTDPHNLMAYGVSETTLRSELSYIKKVYNNTPTSFILSGGDWLGAGDSKEYAIYKLGMLDGIVRGIFKDEFYPIIGNHDTNYQGVDATGAANTGRLPQNTIRNLWFRNYGKMYYSFKKDLTRFYVFDTGIDWVSTMNDYRYKQSEWFANELKKNDDKYSAIALHIFTNQEKEELENQVNPEPFAALLAKIASAYNGKTTVEVNGHSYDFSSTTGKLSFLLCGHCHYDANVVYNGIPIIITKNTDRTADFDLCLVDHTNGKLKMVRVGNGDNREISIIK